MLDRREPFGLGSHRAPLQSEDSVPDWR